MTELTAAQLAVARCRARLEYVETNECNRYAVEHARIKLAEAVEALRALDGEERS